MRAKNGEQERESKCYLQRVDAVRVTLQCVQAFFCLWIPYFDHVIVGTGYNEFAIVLHTTYGRQMTDQCVQASTMHNIPNA